MSAITGIVAFGEHLLPRDAVRHLLDEMAPGGYDGSGAWSGDTAALGIGVLNSTPDASRVRQPLVSRDGGQVLVFDGRLDNRADLLRLLKGEGNGPQYGSDPELVLAAYRKWAGDCPGRLLGDFAFAVWDESRQRLFCARDVTGGRPFHFVRGRNFFAFASEDEALARLPGVSGAPCPELVAFYLVRAFQAVRPEQTWLKDVSSLLPAHSVSVSREGLSEPVEYWRFEQGPISRFRSDAECREAFLEVFGASLRCRMRVGGVPAAILSGGMDSAALAAMAGRLQAELPGGKIQAYSAIADIGHSSLESRCIRSLTAPAYVNEHLLRVPSLSGIAGWPDLERAAWANAHPVTNSILITSLMCSAAQRDGHRALLHAPSGDLAMWHFPRYIAPLLRRWRWRSAWREAQAASRNHTYLVGRSPRDLLLKNAWTAWAPDMLRRILRRLRSSAADESGRPGLLNPEFAASLDVAGEIQSRKSGWIRDDEAYFRRDHANATFGPWGVVSCLSGGQRAGSNYGIDLSDPWADRRLLEFFLHLPVDQLFRDGWTKYLARSTFAEDLEDFVPWRSDKEHLGWMVLDRLMRGSSDLIDQSLHDEFWRIEPFVDRDAALGLLARYGETRDPVIGEQLYGLVTLVKWLERLSRISAKRTHQCR